MWPMTAVAKTGALSMEKSRNVLAGLAVLAGLVFAGCQSIVVSGKIVEGPSSVVTIADVKDERFVGPGVAGAEAELRAVRDGLGDRLVSKTTTELDGGFSIGTVDRLTSETLYLIVSKPGYVTAKGPASISAGGKKMLVVLKQVAK